MESNEVVYTIGGVKVLFPFKAYPSQLSMMNKIIRGVQRGQNCLLESPTGSGKSLALLCSAIAWQRCEEEKRRMSGVDDIEKVCTCSCGDAVAETNPGATTNHPPVLPKTPVAPFTPVPLSRPVDIPSKDTKEDLPQPPVNPETCVQPDHNNDEDDFKPSKKRYRTPVPGQSNKRSKLSKGVEFDDEEMEDETQDERRNPHTEAYWNSCQPAPNTNSVSLPPNPSLTKQGDCNCCCHSPQVCCDGKKDQMNEKPKKLPRIYFGTRTHKQIAQIVKEMGRTAYKDTNMTILGSREHLCIHPRVSKGPNKNEGCKDLLKRKFGESCNYYNNVHRIKSQWQLERYGLDTAWDIEDLVRVGKKAKACPYFAVRGLKDEANVVFCPYNYLIDPKIRKSMDIVLKDQIVILDEAHNIEDSSREAASLTVTTEQFTESIAELDKLIKEKWRVIHCEFMRVILTNLLKWIESSASNLNRCDFERESRIWTGVEMVAILHNVNITPDNVPQIVHHVSALCEENEKDAEHSLPSNVASLLEGLFLIFEYLFRDNMRFMKDYKIALMRTISRKPYTTNHGWMSRRKSNQHSFTVSLNFWCMNPAVAFSDLQNIRSIILTSGTLSPMDSFSSELGTEFPIQLEANHVIHKSQIFVSTIAFGPNGHSLNASYKSSESYNFQDEVGHLLLQVCRIIPYGVLMFFPSYSMMTKLQERWQNTGLWDKLNELKVVLSEPRGNNTNEFDSLLRQFYDVIKECEQRQQVKDIDDPIQNGAVFLAVCRGKVSEGMDFTDNNARAVLTVGIPFPHFKDKQVELKRQYNDKYSAEKGLLTGSAWYEIQAYRAINQALGRCIRHRLDWGALILVDERYARNPNKYISGLSKWIRNSVIHTKHAGELCQSLEDFIKVMKEKQKESLNISTLPSAQMTPSTQSFANCASTPGEKPTFATMQQFLKSKSQQTPTHSQHGLPQTPVNALPPTPVQAFPQTPALPQTPVQALFQPVAGPQPHPQLLPVPQQTVVVSTEAVQKMFQVQQFLRGADGQQTEVRQFVKLAPYQALMKIVENGIDKLLVVDLPKPVANVTKQNNTSPNMSVGTPATTTTQTPVQVNPIKGNPSKVTTSGLIPTCSSPSGTPNISKVNSTNNVLSTNLTMDTEHQNGFSSQNSVAIGICNETVATLPRNQIPDINQNCRQRIGTSKPHIKVEYEQPVLEETKGMLPNNKEGSNIDLDVNQQKLKKKISSATRSPGVYKFVNIPEKIELDSPDLFQGTPDLFDTDSIPSKEVTPMMGIVESETELKKVDNKLVDGEENGTIEERKNVRSNPITRKKLFKPSTSTEAAKVFCNGDNKVEIEGTCDETLKEDILESQIVTRRNRRKKSSESDGRKKSRDMLDDMDPSSGDKSAEPGQCFEGICCPGQHQLFPNIKSLKGIQLSEIKSTFVKDCLHNLQSSHSSSNTSLSPKCQCPVNKNTLTDHQVFCGQLEPSHMTNLSSGQFQISSSGFPYNSYWCEEDNTGYQPLFCCECLKENKGTKMIGLKEVQRTSNGNNIWLFSKHLHYCHHVFPAMSGQVT
ncbi:Fanconi anemia group J protein homolog [Anneissia japonica]|uniref:Fanconi anemia group J protein homolog n=1 Tax=Anneissia japonica TaxID=1529436 RepID=UPI0014256C3C|nr:Fanconi anemia group J protein homolog [Anneissia japonica]